MGGELTGGHLGKSPLRLSPDQLRRIADDVDRLAQTGIDVREFRVDGLVVTLDRTDDQREGTRYHVTAITSATAYDTVCRDLEGSHVR